MREPHRREPRALPREQWSDGHLASVRVYPSAVETYKRMLDIRSQHGPEFTRIEDDGSIWVPYPWLGLPARIPQP